MDTSDSPTTTSTGSTTPTLTSLSKTRDNFESLLLLLLQSHTVQAKSPTESATPTTPTALWDTGISGEALGTLSSEQITTLITSNSVNYEVIQQILAQQKARSLGQGGKDLAATRDQNG